MARAARLAVFVRRWRGRGVYRGKAVQVTALTSEYYECYGGFCRRGLLVKHRGKWYHDEAPYGEGEQRVCRRKGPHPHYWKRQRQPRRLWHGKATKGRAKKARA